MAKRFTIVARTCTATLLVTDFLKTPSGMLLDTSTGYGALLFAKRAAFAVMIVVGLVITFAVAPRLRALAPAPGSAPLPRFVSASKSLDALSAINTALGVAAILLVTLM
ncbi:MAG: CopD family protein [Acidobacteriota bacterium]